MLAYKNTREQLLLLLRIRAATFLEIGIKDITLGMPICETFITSKDATSGGWLFQLFLYKLLGNTNTQTVFTRQQILDMYRKRRIMDLAEFHP